MTKAQKRKNAGQSSSKQSNRRKNVQQRSIQANEKRVVNGTRQAVQKERTEKKRPNQKLRMGSAEGKKNRQQSRKPSRKQLPKKKSKRVKQTFGNKKKRQRRASSSGIRIGVRDFLVILFVTTVVFLSVSLLFFRIEKIQGYSMMPTLTDGNTVFIRKSTDMKRMDMVLFQRGQVQQVRRVIGLPGERIYYKDDVLYVDGEIVDEKFIINENNEAQKNGGQYTEDFQLLAISESQVIPEDRYLVLADNREYGSDSREYGLITGDQIIGIVKARLLPLDALTGF